RSRRRAPGATRSARPGRSPSGATPLNHHGANLKRRKAYMPAGHLGTKRMGELAELAFMYRAASEGIGVADFLVQHGRRLARVQVKSCFTTQRGYRRMGFAIIVAKHARKGVTLYSPDEIDSIAAFVAPHRAWYVIPVEALKGRKSIRLYPGGKSKRIGAFYEDYREAWQLLKEDKKEKDRQQQ